MHFALKNGPVSVLVDHGHKSHSLGQGYVVPIALHIGKWTCRICAVPY